MAKYLLQFTSQNKNYNVQKNDKKKNRQLAIFAGASPTIFAVEVLNFCVRDGNRCFHFAIVTGSFYAEIILSKPNNSNVFAVS